MDKAHPVTKIEWDSSFFSKEIGGLDSSFLSSGTSNETDIFSDFDLVQCKISSSSDEYFSRMTEFGFSLVEGEVDFTKTLVELSEFNGWENCIANESHICSVKSLAEISFRQSRYRTPWYSKKDNSRLYSLWAEKAIRGDFDDVCLIEMQDSKLVGFVTIKIVSSISRIGLICVDDEFRGKGVAKKLLAIAENYSIAKGAKNICVATQLSNVSAINLYARCSYDISKTSYWFYRSVI